MSFLTEVLHKITRKTPTPRIILNPMHSSSVVDSRTDTAMHVLNQCIQPQVGMYSVLAIGDRLDVVVRYEKSLPYTLPVSSDQDCPPLAYVLPRQDMKIGDSFTLFVGREHFMVLVVQILLKSSSNHSNENNSESSSVVNMSNAYPSVPVQSCVDMPSRSPSPSSNTGHHRQTNDVPIPSSPEPMSQPAITTHADRRGEAIFCTRTEIDNGKLRGANTRAIRVAATSSSHPDRVRSLPAELDPIDTWGRPSEKIHQTNPSDINDIPHPVISIAPLPPPTNVQRSRRPESHLPPIHTTILDVSKAAEEKVKSRKRSTTEHHDLPPTMTARPKSRRESQVPLPTESVLGQSERIRREYTSSSVKKTHKTNRESLSLSSPPLGELNNIGGRGHETWTMQDSSPSNATKHRSVSRASYRKSALAPSKIEIQYFWMENGSMCSDR